MIEISIRQDIKKTLAALDRLRKDQIPYATKEAINATAERVKSGIQNAMKQNFDRPTPWTLNSLRIEYASKVKLFGRVWIKNERAMSGGTPPERYLTPEIKGGLRHAKGFELALRKYASIPDTMFMVPGGGADLDVFGNVKRGQIQKITSYFAANRDGGYTSNSTVNTRAKLMKGTKKRAGTSYFVARSHNEQGIAPGIYERRHLSMGAAIRPVFLFTKAPRYRTRLPFDAIGANIIKARFAQEMEFAVVKAMQTQRP